MSIVIACRGDASGNRSFARRRAISTRPSPPEPGSVRPRWGGVTVGALDPNLIQLPGIHVLHIVTGVHEKGVGHRTVRRRTVGLRYRWTANGQRAVIWPLARRRSDCGSCRPGAGCGIAVLLAACAMIAPDRSQDGAGTLQSWHVSDPARVEACRLMAAQEPALSKPRSVPRSHGVLHKPRVWRRRSCFLRHLGHWALAQN